MDEKYRNGLANQVIDEFDNVRMLRETFLQSKACADKVNQLENIMSTLYSMYLDITRPDAEE